MTKVVLPGRIRHPLACDRESVHRWIRTWKVTARSRSSSISTRRPFSGELADHPELPSRPFGHFLEGENVTSLVFSLAGGSHK